MIRALKIAAASACLLLASGRNITRYAFLTQDRVNVIYDSVGAFATGKPFFDRLRAPGVAS